MKNKRFFPSILIGVALISLTLMDGCKKESTTASNDDFQAEGQEVGQAEDLNTSMDNMAGEAAMGGDINGRLGGHHFGDLNSCAVVTHDTVNHVDSIYFNNCTGRNGHVTNGYIIIQHQGGGYWDVGASWDMSFLNFSIDGRHITGNRHVINNGPASNGMTWAITANITITRLDGTTRTWITNRTRQLSAGYGDSTLSNNIYIINGTGSTSDSRTNRSASITISNLTRDMSCAWITAGTIVVTPSNRPQSTIDFGNGTCDNQATVTRNGVTRTIVLHHP